MRSLNLGGAGALAKEAVEAAALQAWAMRAADSVATERRHR